MPALPPTKCTSIVSSGTEQIVQQSEWFRKYSQNFIPLLEIILGHLNEINKILGEIKTEDRDFYNFLLNNTDVEPIPVESHIQTDNTNTIQLESTINKFNYVEFDTTSSNTGTIAYYTKYINELDSFASTQTLPNGGGTAKIVNVSTVSSTSGGSLTSVKPRTNSLFNKLYNELEALKAACVAISAIYQNYAIIGVCFQQLNQNVIDTSGNVIVAPGADPLAVAQAQGLLTAQFSNQNVFTSGFTFPPIDRINFREQCFLLAHIFHLTELKEEIDHGIAGAGLPANPLGYKELPDVTVNRNRTVLVNGEPFGIVNVLTQSPYKKRFFEMTNEQLSTLQPLLRFYKVVQNESENNPNGCKEKEVEIVFDTFDSEDDLERMFKPRSGARGIGVGVKSFNFAYEADNPFAIKKAISATLSIHANNFSELLRPRYNSTQEYSYIDLALHTVSPETVSLRGAGSQTHIANLDKLNFRLKVVMGWTVPRESRGLFDPGLLDAIYDSSITMNLTPTVHTFDIDDAGVVTFNIDYLAYTQEYFDNASFNIFTNYFVFTDNIRREIALRALNAKIKLGGSAGERAEEERKEFLKKTENAGTIRAEKEKSLRSLMTDFLSDGRLYYINFDTFDQALYGLNSPFAQAAARYPTLASLKAAVKPLSVPGIGMLSPNGALATQINAQINASAQQIAGQQGTGTASGGGAAGFFQSLSNIFSSSSSTATPAATSIVPPPSSRMVAFFYASDLIDVILKKIEESLKYVNNIVASDITSPAGNIAVVNVDSSVVECLILAEKEKYARLYENFNKLRIMLGPMEIQNPSENSFEYEVRNIGDTPVSMKNFLEFLTTKMINLEKPQYYLTQFINDFFNEFVVNLMNRDLCYGGKAVQKIFLHENTFTEFRNDINDQDTITQICNNPTVGINPAFQVKCPTGSELTCTKRVYLGIKPPILPNLPKPILNVMGVRNNPTPSADICLEYNYMFFYAGRAIPMNQMVGCKQPYTKQDSNGNEQFGCFNSRGDKVGETGDHSRGIWHYQIGKNRGIVKTISLSKTDSTGLAEVRYEQEGYDGLKQLRVLYDVTIKSFLDISAFPGNYIYVEPRGFDIASGIGNNVDLTQLGIGGYHMIYKSEHTISPGTAETTIHAKWVASNSPTQEVIPTQSNTATPTKCGA